MHRYGISWPPFDPVRVGVIGLGQISSAYLKTINRSPVLQLVAVAARTSERAEQVARGLGVNGGDVHAVLNDHSIELVVNLSPANEHDHINRLIIQSGKSVYSEKPFSHSLSAAQQLVDLAAQKNVRIATAPDTFLGAAQQRARKLCEEFIPNTPVPL